MGDRSKIEWTQATWNPTTGCSKVSPGCKNCYAERLFPRVYGKERAFTDVQLHQQRLDAPLRWRKPRMVFVDSMSDLFHEDVPWHFIDSVFATMFECQWHTFQVLTKRPERVLEYFSCKDNALRIAHKIWWGLHKRNYGAAKFLKFEDILLDLLPLPNVWLGVSVEDQKTADERIPFLLQTPAAVRFVSQEPALGLVDYSKVPVGCGWWATGCCCSFDPCELHPKLDWVIAGGESGPKARPSHPDWFRSVRDQCQEAGIPFFMKQVGGRVKKSIAAIPPDLMIREFPDGF